MEARELLWKCRRTLKVIRRKEERAAALRASIEMARAIRPNQDNIKASIEMDPIGNRMAEIMEIDAEIDHISDCFVKARKVIRKLQEPVQREALELYYLTPSKGRRAVYTWYEVAKIMGYHENHVGKIHKKALRELDLMGKL